jgi:CubicO group peptidase (beta-lactamase class C family)
MIKKLTLLTGAILLVAVAYMYVSEPTFWNRYINGLRTSGNGAASALFDYRMEVFPSIRPYELPTAVVPSLEPAALAAMVEYAEAFNSFALVVVRNGEIQLEWYREDYSRESLTRSGGMHKSLQALLVGVAVQAALIGSIDDRIGDYIDELNVDERGDTRIRDYLQMSAGLKPFGSGSSPFSDALRWLYAKDINAATLAIPQVSSPGVEFDYHDANTQMLGILLDRVYARPYADYLYDVIWNPVGAGLAEVWLDRDQGVAHHSCCLLARAIDWANVGQMMLQGGQFNGTQVVSEEWIAQQITPNLTPHFGFQTWLASNAEPNPRGGGFGRTEPWLADDVFFFSGHGAQRVYVSREKGLVIVRLGPAAGSLRKIAKEWDNTFLFNTAVRGFR